MLLLVLFATSLVACSTVQGVGKDVQKAGEKLEDAIKEEIVTQALRGPQTVCGFAASSARGDCSCATGASYG